MPRLKAVEVVLKALSALATAGLAIIKFKGYADQLKTEQKEVDNDLDLSSLD